MTNPVQIDVEAAAVAVCAAYDVFGDVCTIHNVEVHLETRTAILDTMHNLVTADSDAPFAFRAQAAHYAFSKMAAMVQATYNAQNSTEYRQSCTAIYKDIVSGAQLEKFYTGRVNTLNRLASRTQEPAAAKKPSVIR